jgi:hypothetical protein
MPHFEILVLLRHFHPSRHLHDILSQQTEQILNLLHSKMRIIKEI